MSEQELMERINKSLMRDDVQPFNRIRLLADDWGALPKVWHRYFGGDFMASVSIYKPGRKRPREIRATGEGLDEALANLATAVAEYLFPSDEAPR